VGWVYFRTVVQLAFLAWLAGLRAFYVGE
jgi:hypothetical protein